MELLIILLAGLCFGSFITLASYRLPRGEDVIVRPSRCPQCGTKLGVRDLFPVLSWLASRARCRHCQKPVHWRYPATELVTALLFLLAYQRLGIGWPLACVLGLAVGLMVMVVADFEHYIIPDEVHWFLLPLGVAYGIAVERDWTEILSGAGLGLGIGLALCYGYKFLRGREGLGFGDVKFLAVVGTWIGVLPMVPFLFLSGLLGIATALLWRLLKRGEYYPFGPALAASLFICVLYPEVPAAFWNMGVLVRTHLQ